MNNVNNNCYYDPGEEKEAIDWELLEEERQWTEYWENEEYREGKPLRMFPVHPKYQRVLNKIGESNE